MAERSLGIPLYDCKNGQLLKLLPTISLHLSWKTKYIASNFDSKKG